MFLVLKEDALLEIFLSTRLDLSCPPYDLSSHPQVVVMDLFVVHMELTVSCKGRLAGFGFHY